MKFSTSIAVLTALLQSASLVSAAATAVGCYKSAGTLVDQGTYTFQSRGWCTSVCTKAGKAVMALTNGSNCFCGDSIPGNSDKAPDSSCNVKCQGFPDETCGGEGFFWVALSGKTDSAPTLGVDASKPSSTSSAPASVVTIQGQTVTQTAAAKASGGNKGGIIAGVIVALLIVASLIAGGIFFLRRRKRQQLDEEYRRNAQISSIKPSNMSTPDSRIEPNSWKRQSDGSIADNQDYSRRILKVTNA